MGYHVYFRLEATFFYKRCRASMTKHRQQSTRVRAKGKDPIWSQVCPVTIEAEETKKQWPSYQNGGTLEK